MEEKQSYTDTDSRHLAIGCLPAPIALFVTGMIAEHPGPPGPIGWAEYYGWWAVCIAVGLTSAGLAERWRYSTPRRPGLLLGALSLPIGLTGLALWHGQPSTPGYVKTAVEYGFQAIGLIAICFAIVWLCRISWRALKRAWARKFVDPG